MIHFLQTISNISKVDISDFWKEHKLEHYSKYVSPSGYEPLSEYFQENLNEVQRKALNDFIFEKLYNKINRQFLLPFTFNGEDTLPEFIKIDDNNTVRISQEHPEIEDAISTHEKTCFFEQSDDCLFLKFIFSDGYLRNIIILKNMDIIETDNSSSFFVASYNLDFQNKMISVGYNENDFKKIEIKNQDFISQCIHYLSEVEDFFSFQVTNPDPYIYKKLLFNLYERWTTEVEIILEDNVPENFSNSVSRFLSSIAVEERESYVKQLKSILFQEVARPELTTENDTIYPNGWVMRFAFKDGDFTKASSRTDEFEPVYASPIYWSLKDIINERRELLELGLAINLSSAFDEGHPMIYVRMELIQDYLSIYFYKKGGINDERNKKENYLRRLIKESYQALTPRAL